MDSMDRPLTQSLFLEINYDSKAIYTLKDVDHEWNGRVYPSMRRLYLEMGDPTEYQFATTYLLGWKHWQRLCANKALKQHVDDWREELEVKLRCEGVHSAIVQARSGSWQAAKWLVDKGWSESKAGRPSKADVDREIKMQARIKDEYAEDLQRLRIVN